MAEDATSFYPVKAKIAAMAALSFVMSAASFAMASDFIPVRDHGWGITHLFLWLGAALFGVLLVTWLSQLFMKGPIIEVHDGGIRDARFSSDLISWDAIERVGIRTAGFTPFVELHVKWGIREKYARSLIRRGFDAANSIFGWDGIYIGTIGTTSTVEKLLLAIDRHAPERLRRTNKK